MSKEQFSQEDIETFKWDEEEGGDFFENLDPENKVEKPGEIGGEEKPKKDDKPEGKKEPEIKAEDVDWFGEEDTKEESDDSDEGKPKDKPKSNSRTESLSNVGVANFLKEKGIIDFELEEGDELDELDAEQLIEDAYQDSVDQRLQETIAELPDSVKNLVKFVSKGGNPDEYMAQVSKSSNSGISKKMDMSEESNQIKFMKHQLRSEGHDDEYIDFQIETMQDSGRLESMSGKAFNKWKKEQDVIDQEMIKAQEQRVQKAKLDQLQYKKSIAQKLSETKNINNLKFNRNDSRDLPDYISNPSVELEDGRRVSSFHKDIFEAIKDPEKVLVMAKLLRNNFDFKDIETSVATEKTREFKNEIQRQKSGRKISSGDGGSQTKRLADYFPD